jgi:hypothetical protein
MAMKKPKHINDIGASEFNQWNYCPKKWYLERTTGIKPRTPEIRKGEEFHNMRGKGVMKVQKTQSALIATIIIGGLTCLFFFLSSVH